MIQENVVSYNQNLEYMKIDPEELISQAQAAKIRGVSHQAIVRLVARGKFKTFKIGDKVFLVRSEVESYKPGKAGRPPTKDRAKSAKKRESKKTKR